MNSEKWRTLTLPKEVIYDLIASHLYAMRGMSNREIVEINLSTWDDLEVIPIKIKMKEEKASRPVLANKDNGT